MYFSNRSVICYLHLSLSVKLNYPEIDDKINAHIRIILEEFIRRYRSATESRNELSTRLQSPSSSLRTPTFPASNLIEGEGWWAAKAGRKQREDPRDRLGRRERGRAATMIPGIEKRLTTAARIATQLLDHGVERRRFPPPPPCLYLSPLPSILTLPDSDERERRRRRRRFNDNAGYGDGKESDTRSVKKLRSETRQLLNLATIKRPKEAGFNEVTDTTDFFFHFDSQKVFANATAPSLFFYDGSTQSLVELRNKSHKWPGKLYRILKTYRMSYVI